MNLYNFLFHPTPPQRLTMAWINGICAAVLFIQAFDLISREHYWFAAIGLFLSLLNALFSIGSILVYREWKSQVIKDLQENKKSENGS